MPFSKDTVMLVLILLYGIYLSSSVYTYVHNSYVGKLCIAIPRKNSLNGKKFLRNLIVIIALLSLGKIKVIFPFLMMYFIVFRIGNHHMIILETLINLRIKEEKKNLTLEKINNIAQMSAVIHYIFAVTLGEIISFILNLF